MARSGVIKLVLEEAGIDPERFDINWVSSAEALRFAELVRDFTEKIKTLSPNTIAKESAVAG